ncbi:MAG: DUF4043 family protein [Pikeienuella sp.]
MAQTTISTANRVKQWDAKAHREYVRSNRFKRYMGTSQNSIIMLQEDLTKKRGDAVTCPLLGALDSSAGYNDGSTDLVGNEKALPNDGHQISIGVVRDATLVNVEEEQASPVNIRNAGKQALKDLQMRYLRNDLIEAFGSIAGVAYGSATETNKDAWLATNSDRVLFGASGANNSGNDHSASLLNVDTASDKLSRDIVSRMKRMAQTASNVNGDGIRPYRFGEDEETYVMFVDALSYRDLKADMSTVHTDAEKRGKMNPLFTGTTSLYWDGVVVREIPEIASLGAVGASSATVSPVYLCGTQALGVAWAKRTTTTVRKEDDYGFKYGVGFMELRGVDKMLYGSGTSGKQWGMVTGYVAAAADG